MTVKEAIRRIKVHNKVHSQKEHNAILITKALDMAVEALEKQIPKKPDISLLVYDTVADVIYDSDDCPSCHVSYDRDHDKYNFCPYCGQAIDWNDDND